MTKLRKHPKPVSLDREVRAAIPTREAAFHLSLSESTLRHWAASENPPIRPVRAGKKNLAWPVTALIALLQREIAA